MKTRLSGLMDGELAEHEAQSLYAALRQDGELRNRWLEYQLVGDTLRGEKDLGVELTTRVMAALDAEPTVLAPRKPMRLAVWRRSALALAATVAGVAVVGWLALDSGQLSQPANVSLASAHQAQVGTLVAKPGRAVVVPVAQPVRQATGDMQEYLIAHEAQSSSLHFRGGAEHIRTVAVFGMANSK